METTRFPPCAFPRTSGGKETANADAERQDQAQHGKMAGDEARSRAADGDETARILGAEIRILPFGILHGANCEFNSGLFLRQSGKRGLEAAGFRSGNSRALEHSLSSCAAVAERLQAIRDSGHTDLTSKPPAFRLCGSAFNAPRCQTLSPICYILDTDFWFGKDERLRREMTLW
ncbi:hypothetical protein MJT46_011769 [Ovis ammon polii x Ovis aries]|nr:hypothetical protein MJT46_011769 [Ovis ammon polii x Ovis aries]